MHGTRKQVFFCLKKLLLTTSATSCCIFPGSYTVAQMICRFFLFPFFLPALFYLFLYFLLALFTYSLFPTALISYCRFFRCRFFLFPFFRYGYAYIAQCGKARNFDPQNEALPIEPRPPNFTRAFGRAVRREIRRRHDEIYIRWRLRAGDRKCGALPQLENQGSDRRRTRAKP